MPARTARALACVWLAACSNPPAARDAPAGPTPPAEAASPCAEPPANALAVLADETCPWALVPSDRSGLALVELATAGPRALAVAAPEACAAGCEWRGTTTAVGPVLVAARASRLREGAEAVWVGAALGGTTVRFTPLWVDRSSVGDVTPLGPSLALAPWVCGSELVLAPAPRLAGAGAEEPSDGLRAATGVYAIADDELQRRAAAPDLGTCTRVAVDLP